MVFMLSRVFNLIFFWTVSGWLGLCESIYLCLYILGNVYYTYMYIWPNVVVHVQIVRGRLLGSNGAGGSTYCGMNLDSGQLVAIQRKQSTFPLIVLQYY